MSTPPSTLYYFNEKNNAWLKDRYVATHYIHICQHIYLATKIRYMKKNGNSELVVMVAVPPQSTSSYFF